MRCARCDQPIRDGEPYIQHDEPGATAAGSTVYLHTNRCRRVQTQTAPTTPRYRPARRPGR